MLTRFTHPADADSQCTCPQTCRTQQCFAVKKGVDGFLDVARATFCRVTEQASRGRGGRARKWHFQAERQRCRLAKNTACGDAPGFASP